LYRVNDLQVGDLAVEIDDKTRRGEWKKVRITKVVASSDGAIRKVEIRDGENRTYVRPITCLVPIRM